MQQQTPRVQPMPLKSPRDSSVSTRHPERLRTRSAGSAAKGERSVMDAHELKSSPVAARGSVSRTLSAVIWRGCERRDRERERESEFVQCVRK